MVCDVFMVTGNSQQHSGYIEVKIRSFSQYANVHRRVSFTPYHSAAAHEFRHHGIMKQNTKQISGPPVPSVSLAECPFFFIPQYGIVFLFDLDCYFKSCAAAIPL